MSTTHSAPQYKTTTVGCGARAPGAGGGRGGSCWGGARGAGGTPLGVGGPEGAGPGAACLGGGGAPAGGRPALGWVGGGGGRGRGCAGAPAARGGPATAGSGHTSPQNGALPGGLTQTKADGFSNGLGVTVVGPGVPGVLAVPGVGTRVSRVVWAALHTPKQASLSRRAIAASTTSAVLLGARGGAAGRCTGTGVGDAKSTGGSAPGRRRD